MKFYYPVPPGTRISRGFGIWHKGIDFAVPMMTRVTASQDGIVSECYPERSGYGMHVVIEHYDGNKFYRTIYAHLTIAIVFPGDRVETGDLIGYSGSTGNSTGPHLHFEVRAGYVGANSPVNPGKLEVLTTTPPADVKEVQCPACGLKFGLGDK